MPPPKTGQTNQGFEAGAARSSADEQPATTGVSLFVSPDNAQELEEVRSKYREFMQLVPKGADEKKLEEPGVLELFSAGLEKKDEHGRRVGLGVYNLGALTLLSATGVLTLYTADSDASTKNWLFLPLTGALFLKLLDFATHSEPVIDQLKRTGEFIWAHKGAGIFGTASAAFLFFGLMSKDPDTAAVLKIHSFLSLMAAAAFEVPESVKARCRDEFGDLDWKAFFWACVTCACCEKRAQAEANATPEIADEEMQRRQRITRPTTRGTHDDDKMLSSADQSGQDDDDQQPEQRRDVRREEAFPPGENIFKPTLAGIGLQHQHFGFLPHGRFALRTASDTTHVMTAMPAYSGSPSDRNGTPPQQQLPPPSAAPSHINGAAVGSGSDRDDDDQQLSEQHSVSASGKIMSQRR